MHFWRAIVLGVGVSVLVSGCAFYTQTSFTEQPDSTTFTGQGGTVKVVRGIEIWTDGGPSRRFRILGIIEQVHYDNPSLMAKLAGGTKESDLITAAKQHGGDALMFIGKHADVIPQTSAMETTDQIAERSPGNPGAGGYSSNVVAAKAPAPRLETKTNTRWAVIKYLP